MTAAFVAANQQSHRWEQKFSIPQGYRLLPQNKLAQAQMCLATHERDGAPCEDYKQLRYVRLLGVPGFDHAHTRALVSVIKSCGHLCGSGGIFAVEKTAGTWQRSRTDRFHSRLQLDVLSSRSLGKNRFLNILRLRAQRFVALEKTNAGVPAQNGVVVAGRP